MNGHITIGKGRTVEGGVTKAFEVVGQQVASIEVDIICEIGKVVMMDASCHNTFVAINIVKQTILESDIVAREQ